MRSARRLVSEVAAYVDKSVLAFNAGELTAVEAAKGTSANCRSARSTVACRCTADTATWPSIPSPGHFWQPFLILARQRPSRGIFDLFLNGGHLTGRRVFVDHVRLSVVADFEHGRCGHL